MTKYFCTSVKEFLFSIQYEVVVSSAVKSKLMNNMTVVSSACAVNFSDLSWCSGVSQHLPEVFHIVGHELLSLVEQQVGESALQGVAQPVLWRDGDTKGVSMTTRQRRSSSAHARAGGEEVGSTRLSRAKT